jgi:hypothetical protein
MIPLTTVTCVSVGHGIVCGSGLTSLLTDHQSVSFRSIQAHMSFHSRYDHTERSICHGAAHVPRRYQELAGKRKELAPDIYAAFRQFGQRVFADGALPSKTKQLIAVAVAHVTQFPIASVGTLTLPGFNVHQDFDNVLMNGERHGQGNGTKPAIHRRVQA